MSLRINRILKKTQGLIFVLICSLSTAFAGTGGDLGPRKKLFKIHEVQIKGTKKVEKEAILEMIGSEKGTML